MLICLLAQSIVWHYETGGSFYNSSPAVADIDGDGLSEIITTSEDYVTVLEHDGSLKWRRTCPQGALNSPTVADLEGDGTIEIVSTGSQRIWVLDAASGDSLWAVEFNCWYCSPTVANVDGVGPAEILVGQSLGAVVACYSSTGSQIWSKTISDGTRVHQLVALDIDEDNMVDVLFTTGNPAVVVCLDAATGDTKWTRPLNSVSEFAIPGLAVADVDADGYAEIVIAAVDSLYCLERNGVIKWTHFFPGGGPGMESQVAIADLDTSDGNPKPNIVFYSSVADSVFVYRENQTGTGVDHIWSFCVTDANSGPSPTLADMNGDGILDVLIVALTKGYVLSGADGSILYNHDSLRNPTFAEHGAVVADVDGDGLWEMVATYWNTQIALVDGFNGQGTRKTFQSYTYHITNVCDDLTVPSMEEYYWKPDRHNSYLAQIENPPPLWDGNAEDSKDPGLKFSLVGNLLMVTGTQNAIKLVDVTGRVIQVKEGPDASFRLSRAGLYLVVSGAKVAKLVYPGRQ